ncbi:replication protein P [Enterobacteriaceae bacterium H20N1]|uniref:Replication protein P n=1 Tax=Dryocola boscaweniae TaxID=2925397 RepID=A0A9X2W8F1_9ENTR|nr:replication protein P [Dryocola boscaweniae]MCT4701189.1 replication protein P [Dryocola boscaweniae]MCT4718306.1 replication protein P [Dryocola boscaweniae]
MTANHLSEVCSRLVEQCSAGNTWPPDLSEFIALASQCAGGTFGLSMADVTAEYARWKSEGWRFSSSEEFPWKHPVLYHICVEMRRECVERKLSQQEMDKLAALKLTRWEKKVAAGYSIPPIRRKIEAKAAAGAPTPAQKLHEEYLRRKAAGKI